MPDSGAGRAALPLRLRPGTFHLSLLQPWACPRCGQDDAGAWRAQQRTRLLPVPYFLVTFTVPEELREPIRAAMKPWYGALLKESAGALQDLAADPKHLGAELGLTAMLQTWTRDLRYHPHVHLLVPGGGLTANQLRWVRVKNAEYFLPLRSRVRKIEETSGAVGELRKLSRGHFSDDVA